jgi:hypothetical protein
LPAALGRRSLVPSNHFIEQQNFVDAGMTLH